MNRKKLIAMGLIAVMGLSVTACSKEEAEQEVRKVAVEVQNPESGELTVETAYIGTISPQEQVYVIPMASGTITETFVSVGDVVKEGDVLFKIDDEAARLQLKSAQSSYDMAVLGNEASTGGGRHISNYQTQAGLDTLRDNLNDVNEGLEDMEDAYDGIKAGITQLEQGIAAKNQELAQAMTVMQTKQGEYDDAMIRIEAAKSAYAASLTDGSDENTVAAKKSAYESVVVSTQSTVNEYTAAKNMVDTLQNAIPSMQSQLEALKSQKASMKSSIKSTESSRDNLESQISQTSWINQITQNEVYPQTDAASQAQLGAASLGIESAQMMLDYCTVKAPISGVVESFTAEKNGMAAAGNMAAIISNKDSMTVTFQVSEKAKNTLMIGDHVKVERGGQTFDGTITEIGTMAGMQTRLFQVKATITDAGDSLPNGVSVKVYATTQKENSDLIIPYDSVYFSAGDAYVFCVEADKLVKTPITIGLMNDTQVSVVDGLTPDSQIVNNWSSKLRDGAEVEVVSQNGESVQSEETVPVESPEEAGEAEPSEEEAEGAE